MIQHQIFRISHYVLRCVDSCESFLFASAIILSLQLSSTEYWSCCTSTVSEITWPIIEIFFDLFTCLLVHICILSASVVIYIVRVYINLYLFLRSFFMSQRTCRSHMKHWVYHIWSTEYTTYEALNISHMKHWVGHIWSTEYTTYEALNRSQMKHWVDHILSTG